MGPLSNGILKRALLLPMYKVGYIKWKLLNFPVKLCSLDSESLFHSLPNSFKNYMRFSCLPVACFNTVVSSLEIFSGDGAGGGGQKRQIPSPCLFIVNREDMLLTIR